MLKPPVVLLPAENESWSAFVKRATDTEGELMLVLSGGDSALAQDADAVTQFLDDVEPLSKRVQLATKEQYIIDQARSRGIRVVDNLTDLKKVLRGSEALYDAIRVFSPHVWRQKLRTNLQSMGLLSLPKLRVWILIVVSVTLFFFVLFRLLPSAVVRIWPREDTITQTANIFLVLSGSLVDIPDRVRVLELMPVEVDVDKVLTFDNISKEFVGTSARVAMTVINTADEPYSLRKGTRVMNQAGMIFRLQDPVVLDSNSERTVKAIADDTDLYGEIVGERGNVPEGLRWDFPGLAAEEQKLVYAENRSPGVGGITDFRTVLHEGDIDIAQKILEQDLLSTAKLLVDERRVLYNTEHIDRQMDLLYYDELTTSAFSGFVLPTQFLGKPVNSVPLEGQLYYRAFGYDKQSVLKLLQAELRTHVEEGRHLQEGSMTVDRLVTHVIDYADDLSWIKLTVDLSGTQHYVLDPLTPTGAAFAKKLRELVKGKNTESALRIVKNLPEVDQVEVNIWPPWNNLLPHIPSHISIEVLSP